MNYYDRESQSAFDFLGKPGIATVFPLSMQHVLAMIVGNITPALIVSSATNSLAKATGESALGADAAVLVQSSLFIAGFATLIQLFPIVFIGSKLPVIMGLGFGYIPTLISVGSIYGLPGILGAQLIGALVGIIVGIFIKPLRKFFPPIVAGTVVLSIGLSLYPTAIRYIGGGSELIGTPEFGAPKQLLVGGATLISVLFAAHFGKGMIKLTSILFGMAVGYSLSLGLDMVDFSLVGAKGWIEFPAIGQFKMEFHIPAIISMIIIFIVNSVKVVGDFSATSMVGFSREVSDDELQGGIIGSNLASLLGAFFGGLPVATYSQNIGIIANTKVISRKVFSAASAIVLAAGFIPKFGALMTTIPQAVIGGATVGVFASIAMSGISLIIQEELSNRNTTIVGLALALGIGVSSTPELLSGYPEYVYVVFGSSSIVISTIVAIVLNILIPKKSISEEQKERDEMKSRGY